MLLLVRDDDDKGGSQLNIQQIKRLCSAWPFNGTSTLYLFLKGSEIIKEERQKDYKSQSLFLDHNMEVSHMDSQGLAACIRPAQVQARWGTITKREVDGRPSPTSPRNY